MTVKDELHQLVDQVDDETAAIVRGYIRWRIAEQQRTIAEIVEALIDRVPAEDAARVRAFIDALAHDDPVGASLALAPRHDEQLVHADLTQRMGPSLVPGSAFFSQQTDLDTLVRQQGVKPVTDTATLRADFWPENETADEFIATIRQWRREGGYA